MDALAVVEESLRGTGLNLAGSCPIGAYDRRAPAGSRSSELMPRARGVVVVGSAGPDLWAALRVAARGDPARWALPHPLDSFVAEALHRADEALAHARIGSRRFEPTLEARPAVDFCALGEIAGLGSMGPFGLLIHETHGPWWALRGAWLVDVPVAEPRQHRAPCAGCHAPCLTPASDRKGDSRRPEGILLATPSVRGRCVVGQGSRYTEEQIAYHYDRDATLERLREPQDMA